MKNSNGTSLEQSTRPNRDGRGRWALAFGFIIWLACIFGGAELLWSYKITPGEVGPAAQTWPGESTLPASGKFPTLVMFLHPKCPCSEASLKELKVLLEKKPGQFQIEVVFLQPSKGDDSWKQTDLWKTAQGMKNVQVTADLDGREAKRFGVETSGDTFVFAPDGKLAFRGGITAARGHLGDNVGLTAVEAIAEGKPQGVTRTPVFGCGLFNSEP